MVNNLEGPSVLAKKPDLVEHIFDSDYSKKSGFGTKLSSEWSWVRVPEADACRIIDNDEAPSTALLLRAGRAPLSTMYSRNILVRLQEAFCFGITAALSLDTLYQLHAS